MEAGAGSPATASTVGWCRSGCGASIRTKRSIDLIAQMKTRGQSRASVRRNQKKSAAGFTQAHNHVDARDFIAARRDRHFVDNYVGARNVDQLVVAFDKEVVMVGGVGVEIGLGAID